MDIHYTLDEDDIVIRVGGDWTSFALANQGPQLLEENVLGRRLFSFVRGEETGSFWRDILDTCRSRETTYSMFNRCDAPFEKRLFRMDVNALQGGLVSVSHSLVSSERFSPGKPLAPLKAHQERVRCSNCYRFKVGESWPDAYVTHIQRRIPTSYSVCDACRLHAQSGFRNDADDPAVDFLI